MLIFVLYHLKKTKYFFPPSSNPYCIRRLRSCLSQQPQTFFAQLVRVTLVNSSWQSIISFPSWSLNRTDSYSLCLFVFVFKYRTTKNLIYNITKWANNVGKIVHNNILELLDDKSQSAGNKIALLQQKSVSKKLIPAIVLLVSKQ